MMNMNLARKSPSESPTPFRAYVDGQVANRAAMLEIVRRHTAALNGDASHEPDDPARVAINALAAELEALEYAPVPEGYAAS